MIPGKTRYGLSVLVSPDGQTFGTMVPTGYGFSAFHLDGDALTSVKFGSASDHIRWAQPSGDGHLLMLRGGSLFNRNGRTIKADWLEGSVMIPTSDPHLVLDVRLDQKLPDGRKLGKVSICSTADCKAIDFEMGFEELLPRQIYSWHDIRNALILGTQWRVQYAPSLHRIITLPAGNDRIVTRSWNIAKKMKMAKRDYLYLDSLPPLAVQAEETMTYRIRVQSSHKKTRIALEDGPEGAKLFKKNQIKWTVPAGYADDWARFLVSIENGAGEELLHSFEVAIRPANEKAQK